MIFTQNSIATRIKQPQAAFVNIGNTNTTNQVTLLTAGPNASKVIGIILNNSDVTPRNITINANNGATAYPLTTISVPAGAGNGTVNSVSVFADSPPGGLAGKLPQDNDAQSYIFVPGSNTLTFQSGTTLTNNSVFITGIVIYADF